MSYDPYAYGSDVPPPDDGPGTPPFDNKLAIRRRVQGPAIALIVVGILNLFVALYLVFNTIVLTLMPANTLKSQQLAIFKSFAPAMEAEAANQNADEMKRRVLLIYWPLTVFALLASILPIAGGIRMLSLKSHALGVCAAIAAAVPCISATACCGLGEGIGIWALVVLLNEEVRSAFR